MKYGHALVLSFVVLGFQASTAEADVSLSQKYQCRTDAVEMHLDYRSGMKVYDEQPNQLLTVDEQLLPENSAEVQFAANEENVLTIAQKGARHEGYGFVYMKFFNREEASRAKSALEHGRFDVVALLQSKRPFGRSKCGPGYERNMTVMLQGHVHHSYTFNNRSDIRIRDRSNPTREMTVAEFSRFLKSREKLDQTTGADVRAAMELAERVNAPGSDQTRAKINDSIRKELKENGFKEFPSAGTILERRPVIMGIF